MGRLKALVAIIAEFMNGKSEKGLKPFTKGVVVALMGASGAGYFGVSHQISAEFTARAENALTVRGMHALKMDKFKEDVLGCSPSLHGAQIVAEDKDGKTIHLLACVSRTTEVRLVQYTAVPLP